MITPSQRQILEAVLESLPKQEDSMYAFEIDDGINGYGAALDDVRAIINEFLETEEKS